MSDAEEQEEEKKKKERERRRRQKDVPGDGIIFSRLATGPWNPLLSLRCLVPRLYFSACLLFRRNDIYSVFSDEGPAVFVHP